MCLESVSYTHLENTSLPDLPDRKTAYEMLVEMNKNQILRMEELL